MTRIGINIDHVATIRNARGEDHPNVYQAAKFVSKCKVDSITIHLREDRRHINENDISYYLHRPTATDKTMAPEGNDCFYVLVPVPNNQSKINWETEGEKMKNLVIEKMEKEAAA